MSRKYNKWHIELVRHGEQGEHTTNGTRNKSTVRTLMEASGGSMFLAFGVEDLVELVDLSLEVGFPGDVIWPLINGKILYVPHHDAACGKGG